MTTESIDFAYITLISCNFSIVMYVDDEHDNRVWLGTPWPEYDADARATALSPLLGLMLPSLHVSYNYEVHIKQSQADEMATHQHIS